MQLVGNEEWLLDDLRARNHALVELIKFTDQQAMVLLQMYAGVGVAAGAGALAALTSDILLLQALGWAGLFAVAPLFVGCIYCLRATMVDSFVLPGRGADFWHWASQDAVEHGEAFEAYFVSQIQAQEMNRAVNATTAGALKRAKYCALWATFGAVPVAGIALLTLTLAAAAAVVPAA